MSTPVEFKDFTNVVVFGASGDLAKKKTFPALFGLYREGYLSKKTNIIGYARSKFSTEELRNRLKPFFKLNGKDESLADEFLQLVTYIAGPYDTPEGYNELNTEIEKFDSENKVEKSHRLFYLALPPSTFTTVASNLKKYVHPEEKGICRLIVEKPFGHDLESAQALQKELAPIWSEEELYRIDHYLGKEMVKNLIPLRFANQFLSASWNKEYISSIQISFKEPFGTEGRGGYFDSIGIIRDVMQNHIFQVLTLLLMEQPKSTDSEAVRDEKVNVLKAIKPFDVNNILVGQYTKSEDGSKPGYLDDETVQAGSKCVTFAAMTLEVDNDRWRGVPIVLRAGKALNDGKVEIRVQFKEGDSNIYPNLKRNELVIRIQPHEAMYMKLNSKIPGISTGTTITELDLSYQSRYKDFWIPEAYESLIRDCFRGDHSNFVRDDELDISWALFTPLLNHLESSGVTPEPYAYGSRGPASLSDYLAKNGYVQQHSEAYQWPVITPDSLNSKI